MPRSLLFRSVERALRKAGAGTGPRALSRRSFLALSAAAAACSAIPPAAPHARGAKGVGIVGGGAAGLTAAYRLAKAGASVTLYEASDRWGGRMFTRRNFNADGQFCELGGELVDSNHAALQTLAQELGVAIQRLAPVGDPAREIYNINDRFYVDGDMIGADGQGAFREAAARIASDQEALLDAEESWTEHAVALDNMSLNAYLNRLARLMPDWALELLDLAYTGEYGIPTGEQSALNLVDFISVDPAAGFAMFGDSDELFRIQGGSSTLIEALQAQMPAITQNQQWVLREIGGAANAVTLAFDTPSGVQNAEHDVIVLALPFTKLRDVAGLETLSLSETKLRSIRELGYGTNSKIMVSTNARPWSALTGLPAPSNGSFYSDRGMQMVWETSRGQDGARGILTNFLATEPSEGTLAAMREGLTHISPEIAASLDTGTTAAMVWPRQPWMLGSYAGAKVGQYTTMLEENATPALGGRVQFAGEHTSIDFIGFMNGAVESGERVAQALLEQV